MGKLDKVRLSVTKSTSKRKELSDKIMVLLQYQASNFNDEFIVENDSSAIATYKSMSENERDMELEKLKADFYALSPSKFASKRPEGA